MSYLYTKVIITMPGESKGYEFEIVATDSLNLDRAITDAEGSSALWGNLAPSDAPQVQWSGEQEVSNNKVEKLIMDIENREGYASHYVEQVLSDLNHKGWAYISIP